MFLIDFLWAFMSSSLLIELNINWITTTKVEQIELWKPYDYCHNTIIVAIYIYLLNKSLYWLLFLKWALNTCFEPFKTTELGACQNPSRQINEALFRVPFWYGAQVRDKLRKKER